MTKITKEGQKVRRMMKGMKVQKKKPKEVLVMERSEERSEGGFIKRGGEE